MRMNNERSERRERRVTTNVSLDAALVAEARALGVNISKASAAGLENAVAAARAERWLKENQGALDSSNAFVESNGLPLHTLRQF
jgi:antitoxin CcdA